MGQVGERPQWLFSSLPSTRNVAESLHIGSDWGTVDEQIGKYPQLPITANPRDSDLDMPEDSDSSEQRRSMNLSFLRRLGVASQP